MNVGTSDKHTSVDGYYSHDGSLAQVDLSANYHEGQYTSAGLSLQGGATLTAHGGALHRTQNMGGTRLLIDADGVADVPVEGNGAAVYTNMFGKAVVSDVNNYYRNQAYIDLNKLPENAEATQSVVQATLTEGAIGYRKFAVISGQKSDGGAAFTRRQPSSVWRRSKKMITSRQWALSMMTAMFIWLG